MKSSRFFVPFKRQTSVCLFPVLVDSALRIENSIRQKKLVPFLRARCYFLTECVKQGALLTLYTNILLKLSSCESPAQEMTVLTDMVNWCTHIKVK